MGTIYFSPIIYQAQKILPIVVKLSYLKLNLELERTQLDTSFCSFEIFAFPAHATSANRDINQIKTQTHIDTQIHIQNPDTHSKQTMKNIKEKLDFGGNRVERGKVFLSY